MELPYLQITDEKEVAIYLWMKGMLTMLANQDLGEANKTNTTKQRYSQHIHEYRIQEILITYRKNIKSTKLK